MTLLQQVFCCHTHYTLKIELFALKEEKKEIAHLSEKHMETQSVTLSLGEQRGQRVVGRKKERSIFLFRSTDISSSNCTALWTIYTKARRVVGRTIVEKLDSKNCPYFPPFLVTKDVLGWEKGCWKWKQSCLIEKWNENICCYFSLFKI